jgi:hypothetical protein
MTDDRIRDEIARDLRPVRPLWTPSRRALALVPLAIAVVVGVPILELFRSDMSALGFFRTWGLSIAEAIAGLIIVSIGLRQSVPGRSLGNRALFAAAILGLAVPLVGYRVTTDSFGVGPTSWEEWRYGVVCLRVSLIGTAPLFVVAALLASRGLPVRPVAAGSLYGLGCGIVADAGLRLYCEFTTVQHVILEHFGAVVVSMILGAVVSKTAGALNVYKDRARPATRDRR